MAGLSSPKLGKRSSCTALNTVDWDMPPCLRKKGKCNIAGLNIPGGYSEVLEGGAMKQIFLPETDAP